MNIPPEESSDEIRAKKSGPRNPAKKKPRQLPAGVLLRVLVRYRGSEVALNANVERNRVLVLVAVERGRLTGRRGEGRTTGEALVQMGPDGFRREGQVLDGGPPGDRAEFRDAEVRVAGVGAVQTGNAGAVGSAVLLRGSTVVTNPAHAAEQARRP